MIKTTKLAKNYVFAWVIGAVSVALVGCGEATDTEAEFAIAKEALETKNYAVMSVALKKLLQAKPEDAEARFLLGKAEIHLDRGASAEVQLNKALKFGIEQRKVVPWMLKAWMYQKKFQNVISSESEGQIAAGFADQEQDKTLLADVKGIIGVAHASIGDIDKAKQFFATALSLSPSNGYALVGNAQITLKTGDAEEAKQQLLDAVKLAPEHAPGWSLLSDAYISENNTDLALEALNKAVTLRPGNVDDRIARAILLAQQKEFEQALSDAKTMANFGYGVPHGEYIRALTAYFQGDLPKAKTHIQTVIAEKGDFMGASCLLGGLQAQTADYTQAEAALERCRAQGRANTSIHRIYAGVLAVNGKQQEAGGVLEGILRVDPNDLPAVASLAKLELANSNPEKAIELLQIILDENAENFAANFQLGRALYEKREISEAEKAFATARALNPDARQASLVEATDHMKSGRLKRALDTLQAANRKWPKDAQILNLLSITHANLNELKTAEQYLEQVIEIDPMHVSAVTNLSKIYIESDRSEQAEKLLKPVVKKFPQADKALGMLLMVQVQAGNLEEAKDLFSQAEKANQPPSVKFRALEINYLKSLDENEQALTAVKSLVEDLPNDPVWLREAGKLELGLGRYQQAIDSLQQAAELDRNNVFGLMMLAQAYQSGGQSENAYRTIEDVLEKSPNYHPALIAELRVLLSRGDGELARKKFDSLVSVSPNRKIPLLIDLEAQLLSLEGNEAGALALVKEAFILSPNADRAWAMSLSDHPALPLPQLAKVFKSHLDDNVDDHAIRFVYADTLARAGDTEAALGEYGRLLEKSPNNPIVLNNMAHLVRKENPTLGFEYITSAIKSAPDNPGILDTYGLFMLDKHKLDEAREALAKAMKLAPKDSEVAYHALQVEVAAGEYPSAKTLLNSIRSDKLPYELRDEFLRIKETLTKLK